MLRSDMVFSSPTFLFIFLPLTLLAYLVVPAGWRNGCLLVASVLFYVWGSGGEVLVDQLGHLVRPFPVRSMIAAAATKSSAPVEESAGNSPERPPA